MDSISPDERKRIVSLAMESLCAYDTRNPHHFEEDVTPPEDCYCDNCFYGRTELSKAILVLIDQTDNQKG